jgi:hypothetical protein
MPQEISISIVMTYLIFVLARLTRYYCAPISDHTDPHSKDGYAEDPKSRKETMFQ